MGEMSEYFPPESIEAFNASGITMQEAGDYLNFPAPNFPDSGQEATSPRT